ncbi:MAG: TlyA family rRNA (cytidine-2'-O)-methyltransferase [Phycisphaerales bacterium]|jgi:23S rRNA (cytidine1920-2'-O)/16S rRNA (cytidine1409-2'-O)-methyltransferase|nr:TlyA family rRNA (cytidine-2'-O)-methyltransferase [Phycisphaerales bacterium]
MQESGDQYVSRGGLKLEAAIKAFDINCDGLICADFGCNIGGFTDCMLKFGAAKVYAVDTGYGTLAWTLRKDQRVVVMERTNALYAQCPEPVDLVVIDVAWTPQKLSVPAAGKWLKPGGMIISLLKPVFELAKLNPSKGGKPGPKSLAIEQSEEIRDQVCTQLATLGFAPRDAIASPIVGKGGNTEFLLLIPGPDSTQ